jgi:hypothetical protein
MYKAAIVASVISSPLAISTANAACHHQHMPWRFDQSFSSTWRTDNRSVCTSTNYHPEYIAKIEIVSKPQHGIAGKNGPYGIAYKPEPGFHGSDAFTYAVTSSSNWRGGAGHVAHVTVFVIVD